MVFRKYFRNPDTTLRLGLAFLVVANGALFFHPIGTYARGSGDGVKGLLYGLAIGLLLLSIRNRRRRGGDPSCA